jgi:hypothetical protein
MLTILKIGEIVMISSSDMVRVGSPDMVRYWNVEDFNISVERPETIEVTGFLPMQNSHSFFFKKLIIPKEGFSTLVLSFLSTSIKTKEAYTTICEKECRAVYSFFQKKNGSSVFTVHEKLKHIAISHRFAIENPNKPGTYLDIGNHPIDGSEPKVGYTVYAASDEQYQGFRAQAQAIFEKAIDSNPRAIAPPVEKQGALKEAEAKEKREPKKEGQGEPKRSKPSKCLVM